LKEQNRWCNWKSVKRNGRFTKLPIDSDTGGAAKSNDENTWSSFETAISRLNQTDGIGYFFKDPYIGIDIDDVGKEIERYNNDDFDNNIVSEFVDILNSYAEVSPSGNGIHIIIKGELPDSGRRRGNIEIYDKGRFFTVTGNSIGGYTHIADDSELNKINHLHTKYIASGEPSIESKASDTQGNHLTEDELIRIATNSKNGTRFNLFLNGGWEQFYDSQSEADMAFANDLAFWTNRDFNKMDNIFRKSSLYRDKYDSKRDQSTYGADTLNKAISSCNNAFNPEQKDDDFNLYIMEDSIKEVKNKFYSYDDTGNADRFVDAFEDLVRYNYTRKNWFIYNGKTWELDSEGRTRGLVGKILERMKKEPVYVSEDLDEEAAQKALQKHIKYSRGSNGKTNMLKESEHLLPVTAEQFDNDTNLLNVENGYIDLKTGELKGHDREKYFSKISAVEYTDKIDHPLWDDFLMKIFNNDVELIEYIQRAVGYSLSGSTEEQIMFILHGNGRNGKSVFLDIITEMLGNYTTNIQPQSIMVKQQSGGASPDIAKLDGARLVTTTEPNDGMRFDEGLVKQLTGGDRVSARFLHENEFEFTPQFKLWMATNHKPIIRGTDDGIWRRMAIIPFNVQIPLNEVDKHLKTKLRSEMTAILNWAVEGHKEWQRIGLKEPETIKLQRGDYRKEMNPIEVFLEECCVIDSEEREKAADVYRVYSDWAKENNEYLLNSTKFTREMQNKFRRVKSSTYYYVGIRLKKTGHEDGVIRLNLN